MKKVVILAALALLSSLLGVLPSAALAEATPAERLRDAVEVDNIRTHQAAFQDAADGNGGTRVAGEAGHDASAAYVVEQLSAAGYNVESLSFEFDFFEVTGVPTFAQAAPVATSYEDGTDFDVMSFSGSGDTGVVPVTAVDLSLEDRAASTSGCESEDFEGFPAGNIALMQRGGCSFALKADNAVAAGAVGAIVFNQGNTEVREGLLFGTLSQPGTPIPVLGATFAVGEALAVEGATASIAAETISETRSTSNVVAQSLTGDPDNVVMAGAHLDSVPEGPGIQDNGTGSGAILEIALQLAEEFGANDAETSELTNAVRFGWWSAEEFGLVGSIDYVSNLSDEELAKIKVYQNYDMIGSPNFVRFVYDGDQSDIEASIGVPANSAVLEQTFLDFFDAEGLETEATIIGQRSDHFAFCVSGIPCGGLFTGAEGLKTADQVEVYGGVEGEQYDPCYHAVCDTFDNISLEALDQMSDAAATAVAVYAFTPLCNGLPVTIMGTDSRDVINGTAGNDVIMAKGGNDSVNGGAGNDTICLGSGNDSGIGAGGDDFIDGEDGDDLITTGSGDDIALGGEGKDRIRVDRGDDIADGGAGNDRLEGDGGEDILLGGADNDTIIGGAQDDLLLGEDGNDNIMGQGGSDQIEGGEGDDRLSGGANADAVTGDAGDDVLRGGGGDDFLDGGDDFDRIFGDVGTDDCSGEVLNSCEGDIGEGALSADSFYGYDRSGLNQYVLKDHHGNVRHLS
ncbi:MAG: M28 family peptidase [Acidimicrobiales bacterium]